MAFFLTGFPGFLATYLVRALNQRDRGSRFRLLVHSSQAEAAQQTVKRLVHEGMGPQERFELIPGDITQELLGLDSVTYYRMQLEVTHLFHLAAVYDLAVPAETAYQVNITGTRKVNRFVRDLRNLKRYVYFSTAYVSGRRMGRILESELDQGQNFKNHYESTKFEAERLVQALMSSVPTTIIRPAVTVGHSTTGETAKFDGMYFIMRFLDRFRRLPIPNIGKGQSPFNIVPVDYVVKAAAHFAFIHSAVNRVYHLTDPSPHTAREVYTMICERLLSKRPFFTIPSYFVSAALSLAWFRRWIGVEKETLEYFHSPAYYDTAHAQKDLRGTGIRCPDLKDYIGNCVEYYQKHRNDSGKRVKVR
jgi:nucleoside-diphosphate-sugar epimerase